MSDNPDGELQAGPSYKSVEIGVALLMALFALIVIGGSLQAGVTWADDGPRAGFFPFYIGLLILVSSVVVLVQTVMVGTRPGVFADWSQLRQVFSVVLPAALYVILMPWIGMYVASFLLIAVFMRRIGRYRWGLTLAVSIAVPLIAFVVFERWFLVPLPKGPLEDLLGL